MSIIRHPDLAQESYIGKNSLGWTLPITKVDRLAVIPFAILMKIDQEFKDILLTGCAGITQFRIIVAVDRIHVRTDNGNNMAIRIVVSLHAQFIYNLSVGLISLID